MHILPLLLAMLAACTPLPAAAASLDLSPLVPALADLVVYGVLAPLAFWGWRRLSAWLRISEDSRVRGYLEEAMLTALDYGRELAVQRGEAISLPDVRSRIVADAAEYLAPKVPDALRHFGIDREGLRQRLVARMGNVTADGGPPASGLGIWP